MRVHWELPSSHPEASHLLMISLLLIVVLYSLTGETVKVQLFIPKVIPSGSSPSLLCQYNLEGESLYAVKWYRGQHEFFRYVPGADPQMVAFPLGGIHVDVLGSGPDKVKLVNVPKYISGKVHCEVSVEKTFKTTADSKNMTILDFDVRKPYLNISSNVFNPKKDMQIICSAQETKPPPLINFYVDYIKISRVYITDFENGTAVLQKEALLDFVNATPGEYISPIWVKCDAFLRGVYHRASTSFPLIPVFTQNKSNKSSRSLLNWSWINLLAMLLLQFISILNVPSI